MKRSTLDIWVGIFVVIGIACIGYLTTVFGKVQYFGSPSYPLYARFTSASGLRAGSPIDIYGIEVGTVGSLSIDQERAMAVVELNVRKGLKVYDDANAAIKTAGLIGDRYVSIDPGGAGELLRPGGWIPQTSAPIDIEDLIGKFAFGNISGPSGSNEGIK